MVRFHGSPDASCVGFKRLKACIARARMAADLGSFVGLGDSSGGGGGPLAPSPFRLPPAYEEAKERKVAAVAELRNAVKAVCGTSAVTLGSQQMSQSRHVSEGVRMPAANS